MLVLAEGTFTVGPSGRPDGSEETQVALALAAGGAIVHAFIKLDLSGVILFVEAESLDAAESLVATLPYAEDGTLVFALSPVKPLFPALD